MKVWIDGILKIDFKGTSNTSKGEELNLRYGLYNLPYHVIKKHLILR